MASQGGQRSRHRRVAGLLRSPPRTPRDGRGHRSWMRTLHRQRSRGIPRTPSANPASATMSQARTDGAAGSSPASHSVPRPCHSPGWARSPSGARGRPRPHHSGLRRARPRGCRAREVTQLRVTRPPEWAWTRPHRATPTEVPPGVPLRMVQPQSRIRRRSRRGPGHVARPPMGREAQRARRIAIHRARCRRILASPPGGEPTRQPRGAPTARVRVHATTWSLASHPRPQLAAPVCH